MKMYSWYVLQKLQQNRTIKHQRKLRKSLATNKFHLNNTKTWGANTDCSRSYYYSRHFKHLRKVNEPPKYQLDRTHSSHQSRDHGYGWVSTSLVFSQTLHRQNKEASFSVFLVYPQTIQQRNVWFASVDERKMCGSIRAQKKCLTLWEIQSTLPVGRSDCITSVETTMNEGNARLHNGSELSQPESCITFNTFWL